MMQQQSNQPTEMSKSTGTVVDQSISESTFESLDMVVENGKPKFRLNEPAFSTVNIPLPSNFSTNDNDDTSFVVLGKSSLDFINTASLLDYEQIQKKSSTVDYNSIISTLSQGEIETKIADLLQENVKLKETLTQNNIAMKHHFNTLVSWQDELMKVHGNHKQKFAETRNLVVSLQKENNDLKSRLAAAGSMTDSRISGEMIGNLHTGGINSFPTGTVDDTQVSNSINDSILIPPGHNVSVSSTITDSNQSTTVNRNYEDIKHQLVENEGMKVQWNLNEQREQNIESHQDIITTIEEHIQKVKDFKFPSLELNEESLSDRPDNPNRQQFFENYTLYNEKLSTLANCYAGQAAHFTKIQDCLKRCIDVLTTFDNIESRNLPTQVSHKNILEDCRNQLVNVELQNIPHRQNLVQAHDQFQKIFSDYNSALIELENIRDQSLKTAETAREVAKEKQAILTNKEAMELEKQQIFVENKRLMEQQIQLNQEKASLDEEKASLNSQSILYEAQMRNLQESMKVLQIRHDDMLTDSTKLKEEIRRKNIELEGIRARLQLSKDDAVMIDVLQQQLNIWKNDFEEEQKAKEQLKIERDDLTNQLRALRNHNQQLLQQLNGPNPMVIQQDGPDNTPIDPFCSTCGSYKSPGQWHGPGFCQSID